MKKRRKAKTEKVLHVLYQDHHWIEDGSTIRDILEQDELGANTVIQEEIGFLLVDHKDYYVISAFRQIDNMQAEEEISYNKAIRILKRDIISKNILKIPRSNKLNLV